MYRLDLMVVIITIAVITGFVLYSTRLNSRYTPEQIKSLATKIVLKEHDYEYDSNNTYVLNVHIVTKKEGKVNE